MKMRKAAQRPFALKVFLLLLFFLQKEKKALDLDYDFTDGFEIIVEYSMQEDLIMHPEMARHLVFLDDGIYYLIDDRVTNSANGSAYRIMGEDFYTLLEELFQ